MRLRRQHDAPQWNEDDPDFMREIDSRITALVEGKPFPAIDQPLPQWDPGATERLHRASARRAAGIFLGGIVTVALAVPITQGADDFLVSIYDAWRGFQ